jgi:hypothetical protein
MSIVASMLAVSAYAQEGSKFPQPAQSPPISYHHASTLQEGLFRGTADGIRALGEFNYNTAAAALIGEEARKSAYANELRHAETFWAKRQLWESQVSTKRKYGPVPTGTLKAAAEPVAARVAPAPAAVDPSQAGVIWPAAFEHPALAPSRDKLAELFSQRTPVNSGASSINYRLIYLTVTDLRSTLSDVVRELPPMAYVEARRFLDQAVYEASLPVKAELAAAN